MIKLKFNHRWGRYSAGEISPVDRALALRLINIGIAEKTDDNPVEKTKPKRRVKKRERAILKPAVETRQLNKRELTNG